MARKSLVNKCNGPQKYEVRRYHRCRICGRPRGYIRKFGMCRICFRERASQGLLPGVKKASW